MRLCLAALYTSGYTNRVPGYFSEKATDLEKDIIDNVRSILESYYYLNVKDTNKIKRTMLEEKKILLDSGAFSARFKTVEIKIDDYIEFIYAYKRKFWGVVSLDVVRDAKASLKNQRIMESNGLKPMPVYHLGEPEKYLHYYVNNYPYVGIGGVKRIKINELLFMLDNLWKRIILDKYGIPKTRMHGFAVTRLLPLWRYPWASIDSTAWVKQAAAGGIPIANIKNIISEQRHKLRLFYVTEKTSFNFKENFHIDNMSKKDRMLMLAQIKEAGFSLKRLRTNHIARVCYHVQYYCKMEKFFTEYWKDKPCIIDNSQRSFFHA